MSEEVKTDSIYQDRTEMQFYNPDRKEIYDLFDEFVDIVFVQGKPIDWEKSCKNGKLTASEANFEDLLKEINVEENQIEKDKNFYENLNIKPELEDYLSYIYLLGSTKKSKKSIDKFNSEKIFPKKGLWSHGGSDMQLPKIYLTLLYIFKKYFEEEKCENVKEKCENVKEAEEKIKKCLVELKGKGKKVPIINFLLHFCDAKSYSTYPLINKQEELVYILDFLLDENKKNEIQQADSLDKKIQLIHEHLVSITGLENKGCLFGLFEDYLNNEDNGKTDLSKLKFKKAIILYGPPGTSKTYTAKKIAKAVLQNDCIEKCIELSKPSNTDENTKTKEQIQDVLTNITKYIYRLQLHPNYSYEDFVWGYEIKDSGKGSSISSAKKGKFLNILEEMKADKKPRVLILDEINRVDLSRLFGELFSAIENRGEDIELPISFNSTTNEKYKINIPENLYIIGTMNEIDFSLERIDFALRRRFAWIFKGFEKDILKQMLEEKDGDFDYTDYIKVCGNLNKKIEEDKENLGEKYVIGHAIFADIAGIRQQLVEKSKTNSTAKDGEDKFNGARDLLWEISIKPLLEAYLGNMDETTQKSKIDDFAKTFGVISEVDNKPGEPTPTVAHAN